MPVLDLTKPMQTRNGRKVSSVVPYKTGFLVVAKGESELPCDDFTFAVGKDFRRISGHVSGVPDPYDILNVPEQREIWVHLCKHQDGNPITGWSWTEDAARRYAGRDLLALKKVTIVIGEGV